MKVLELLGGIGACPTALKRIGVEVEVVDYVEIDKYATASYNAINGTNFEPQDICTWDKNIEVDLIMHGSPCQDFSVAGKQAGGDVGSGTRSSLMYETIRIVGKLRPKYVIWENVKNLLSTKHRHNFDAYLETMKALGYTNYYQVLNAKDYGIPQNRERVFTISILGEHKSFVFPDKEQLAIRLKDLLEDEVGEKYYLSNVQIERMKTTNFECSKFEHRVCNDDGITPTLCARDYKDPKCVQVGTLDIKGMDCIKRVYSDEGLSPTLTDMQGGNRQPKIIDTNFSRHREYSEYSCAIDTYANKLKVENGCRIRKLTPKECWRLMGFGDEDFEKAAKVNSNTQLYKQAGNSIVVNVLEEIFKKLF
jgi:DNA (cytosine-5)-methyltransferase 1